MNKTISEAEKIVNMFWGGEDKPHIEIFNDRVRKVDKILKAGEAQALKWVEKEVIGEDLVITENDRYKLPEFCEVADIQNLFRAEQRQLIKQRK